MTLFLKNNYNIFESIFLIFTKKQMCIYGNLPTYSVELFVKFIKTLENSNAVHIIRYNNLFYVH